MLDLLVRNIWVYEDILFAIVDGERIASTHLVRASLEWGWEMCYEERFGFHYPYSWLEKVSSRLQAELAHRHAKVACSVQTSQVYAQRVIFRQGRVQQEVGVLYLSWRSPDLYGCAVLPYYRLEEDCGRVQVVFDPWTGDGVADKYENLWTVRYLQGLGGALQGSVNGMLEQFLKLRPLALGWGPSGCVCSEGDNVRGLMFAAIDAARKHDPFWTTPDSGTLWIPA